MGYFDNSNKSELFIIDDPADGMFIVLKGQAIGYTPLSYEVSTHDILNQKPLNDKSIMSSDKKNAKNNIYLDKILIQDEINIGNNDLIKKFTPEGSSSNGKQTIFPLINIKKNLFQNKEGKSTADLLNKTYDSMKTLNEFKFIDKTTDLEAIQKKLKERNIFSSFLNKQALYFNSEAMFKFKISTVYKKGEVFGTEWLSSSNKRIMSVISKEPLCLLCIDREHFTKAIEKEELRRKEKIEFMTKVFKGTEFTDVTRISCHLIEQKYDIHEVIFLEGQKTQGFYFIKQGEVEVYLQLILKILG